jgi:hypothetical protein
MIDKICCCPPWDNLNSSAPVWMRITGSWAVNRDGALKRLPRSIEVINSDNTITVFPSIRKAAAKLEIEISFLRRNLPDNNRIDLAELVESWQAYCTTKEM